MPSDSSFFSTLQTAQPPGSDGRSHGAQEDALWGAFASAQTAGEFSRSWLSLQCLQVPDVRAALLLLEQDRGNFVPAAVWPSEKTDASYLAAPAKQCLTERRGRVLREQPGALVVVAYPVQIEGQARGAVVLDVADRASAPLRAVLRQLHWGVGWLEALLLRRQNVEDVQRVQRARTALDVLAVAAEHARLDAMAMAIVNDLAPASAATGSRSASTGAVGRACWRCRTRPSSRRRASSWRPSRTRWTRHSTSAAAWRIRRWRRTPAGLPSPTATLPRRGRSARWCWRAAASVWACSPSNAPRRSARTMCGPSRR